MKLIRHFFSVLACVLPTVTNAGPLPFSIAIDAQQRIRSGSQVEVKLTLTNNSAREVTLLDTNRWCDYEVDTRDSHGQMVPETSYKRGLKCGQGITFMVGRRMLIVLKPGESYEDAMLVNSLYEIRAPGDYYIQVARRIPKELGQGTVKSNVVVVTVTE